MNFGLWAFLSIGAVSLFAVFIPLVTFIENRRKEREAFYKAETLRRLTEASGEGAKAALELTDKVGVDHVVEVGGKDTLSQSIEAAAAGGRIAIIGLLSGLPGQIRVAVLPSARVILTFPSAVSKPTSVIPGPPDSPRCWHWPPP